MTIVEYKLGKYNLKIFPEAYTPSHHFLIRKGFVSIGGYIITKKGMIAVEKIKEISGTEAKVPKLRMEF